MWACFSRGEGLLDDIDALVRILVSWDKRVLELISLVAGMFSVLLQIL